MAVDAVPHPHQQLSRHPLGDEAGDEDADEQQGLAQVEAVHQAGEEAADLGDP